MTGLLRVELGRLFSRRLVRLVGSLGLLAVLLVAGLIAARSNTDVASARARADAQAQSQYQSCLTSIDATSVIPNEPANGPNKADCDQMLPAAQLKSCLAASTASPGGRGPTAQECARMSNPYFQDPRFHFADHVGDLLEAAAFIFVLLGAVIGASFIGAEWQAGTFGSLLTWEPRRQRVLTAKVTAAVLGVAVLTTVITAVLVGGAALAADLRGTMDGTTTHLMGQVGVKAARVLGLVALFTVIGATLAAFTRHTVAAVAVLGGYFVGGEMVGAIVSRWWHNHALGAQMLAFIQGRYAYYVPAPPGTDQSTWNGDRYLHAGGASVVVICIALGFAAVAALTLHRRDVT
jgi:ABC-2 type transport system permease protein